jgi:hypothetical protein
MNGVRRLSCPLLAALAVVAPAAAAEGPEGVAGTIPVVMLAPGAQEEAAAAAGEFRSQLADLPVRFEVRAVGEFPGDLRQQIELARGVTAERGAAMVVWIDFADSGRVYIFVADAEGGRLLVREAGSGGESAEGRLMTMGVIVRGVVRGVLAGDTAPAPAPSPAPPPAHGDGLLDIGLAYGLQFHSDEIPLIHGARIEAGIRLAGPLRLFAAYRAQLPPRVVHGSLVVDLLAYPMELGLALRFPVLEIFDIETGAGAVVTVVDLDITSADRALAPQDDVRRVELAIDPWVGARVRLGPVAALFLRLATDVVVNRHRYVVDIGDRVETVVHPWRARPLLMLGAGFTAL